MTALDLHPMEVSVEGEPADAESLARLAALGERAVKQHAAEAFATVDPATGELFIPGKVIELSDADAAEQAGPGGITLPSA